jgi:Immunity protein 26
MKELPYREGDVFAVPLRNGGFSLGVVARSSKQGQVLLGYFFGEKFASVPGASDLPKLLPENALKVVKFGDLSLMSGNWPIIAHLQHWHRDDWPMPKFIRRDPLTKRARLVSYADEDPNQPIGEEADEFESVGYEEDTLLGAGFVELLLTRLLGPSPTERNEAG